ncbi:MAG: DNA polymerase III subunit delta' [Myxococcales bacterium]|nr:DNA polymerase III subunit delta' [Myxococcales bacterium]
MNTSAPDFRSLVGHHPITRTLQGRYAAGQVPHALLFEGPRGVGKRTTAEALAALLLCHTPKPPGNACQQCPSCYKLGTLTHGDQHVIKPNDRNNIVLESIRATERALHLHPLEGRRKVVLIHEAHRMGVSAQNALLKTLEEPPSETHIILISEKPTSLLPTIQSRCQKVRFGPLSIEQVEEIIVRHRPELPREQQTTLARLSGGAPGQALGLEPDTLFARLETVHTLDTLFDPLNPNGLLELGTQAAEIAKDRVALADLLDAWLIWVRDQLLLATGTNHERIIYVGHRPMLTKLAQQRGIQITLARADALLHARRQLDLPYNLNATMLMEQLLLVLTNKLPLAEL